MSNIGTLSLIAIPGEIERTLFLNNPDITFFKSVYRRHTNFSKFFSVETSEGNENNFGKSVKYKLDNTIGDLLSKVYLQHKITIDSSTTFSNATVYANLGSNIISSDDEDSLNIQIGTNKIFQNNGLYLETKQELMNEMNLSISGNYTIPPMLKYDTGTINCNEGSHNNYTTLSGGVSGLEQTSIDNTNVTTEFFYCIPDFSFNYDYGLALPLCSLRNTDVNFNVKYNDASKVLSVHESITPVLESKCIKEYIHLDVDEKKRFITNSHEYLIEYVKYQDCANDSQSVQLSNVSGLTKYILVVGKPDSNGASFPAVDKSLSTPTEINSTLNISLQIDSNELNSGQSLPRNAFTRLNLYNYFKGCGRNLYDGAGGLSTNKGHRDSIAVFPICIDPLNYTQPSGCISSSNGSVRDIILNLEHNNQDLKIFMVEYNILNISDGHCQKMLN